MKKLKNIPNKESYENYTFRLRKSDADALEQYRVFSSEEYDTDFTMPELLNSVLTTLLEDDKDFQTWIKKGAKTKAKPEAKAETKTDVKPEPAKSPASPASPTVQRPATGTFGSRSY